MQIPSIGFMYFNSADIDRIRQNAKSMGLTSQLDSEIGCLTLATSDFPSQILQDRIIVITELLPVHRNQVAPEDQRDNSISGQEEEVDLSQPTAQHEALVSVNAT
jgi:hypothetical protein